MSNKQVDASPEAEDVTTNQPDAPEQVEGDTPPQDQSVDSGADATQEQIDQVVGVIQQAAGIDPLQDGGAEDQQDTSALDEVAPLAPQGTGYPLPQRLGQARELPLMPDDTAYAPAQGDGIQAFKDEDDTTMVVVDAGFGLFKTPKKGDPHA